MNLVTSRRPTREATGAPKWPLLGCHIRHPRYATLARFGLSQRTNELDQVFVSRQRELERLDGLLDTASEGSGQICFVVGEAGSGKTCLTAEFARRAQLRDEELVSETDIAVRLRRHRLRRFPVHSASSPW